MTTEPALIFVPGIRTKPPAAEQLQQLQRCLNVALKNRGCADPERISQNLAIVGWSYQFYAEYADIQPDMAGIDRLLAGGGDPQLDHKEALSIGRRTLAAMYAIADRFPVISSVFATRRMATRMREINRYFCDAGGIGTSIRQMLKQQLQSAWAQNRPIALIGHSFGSVIAYDTLWELSHESNESMGQVDLFLSMGSPLAMRYIRRRLKGATSEGRRRYPAIVCRWLNLSAIGEVTALDRRMADCYDEMCSLKMVDSITDDCGVLNRFRGPAGLDVHKCYGYFASDRVAEALQSFSDAVHGRASCPPDPQQGE